ncbi:hypothetical protein V5739_01715 [Salinimicrobium sp. TIG7-5_MAKvit]|uniref:hypothetical protein n=1 Tax=Salinimicrobium sp. TIG7-5_MAKvit TaxID=3121289 RepID=UPI003C6E7C29
MNNILISSDVSSLPRSGLLYALHLMRGRKTHFYFETFSIKQRLACGPSYNESQLNCLEFVIKHELDAIQKKIRSFFPAEDYELHILKSPEDLYKRKEKFSWAILNTRNRALSHLTALTKLYTGLKMPFLALPDIAKPRLPKKLLLIAEPGVQVSLASLAPVKKIFGNFSFSLEIHKIYPGKVNAQQAKIDSFRLKEVLNIYHPAVKVFSQQEYHFSNLQDAQNFDLRLLPQDEHSLQMKMNNPAFVNFLSNPKAPTLISPKPEIDFVPAFKRNRNTTKPLFQKP